MTKEFCDICGRLSIEDKTKAAKKLMEENNA